MKIVWLSDTHFYPEKRGKLEEFFKEIEKKKPDIIIHSGDIAFCDFLERVFEVYKENLRAPLYFVLGNHDFYYSSIKSCKEKVIKLGERFKKINYLSNLPPLFITNNTVLVGNDGWADTRFGEPENSRVRLNDFIFIEDFAFIPPKERWKYYRRLADNDAKVLESKISGVIDKAMRFLIVTHAPPFKEITLYGGIQSDNNNLPWFSSKIMGDMILKFAKKYKEKEFIVFCGHTHEKAELIRDNLKVYVAGAEYGNPDIQKIIEIEEK
jgi:predicted phosphodiesterase